ncbi:MAG: tetratricopeptide repeat protein [Gammaproteobacteria bacterium]|nr:tetratricopeptide repeat protein [Gammaproteobacteria bacterium]
MLTFNLYVLPTLIAAGLALGRLDLLCSGRKVWALPVPGRLLSVAGLRIVALALIVLPAVHLATMAWASHLYTRARHAAVEEHRLLEAEQLLRRALELAPNVDTHLVGAAEIYRSVLERLPGDAERERRVVFDHAMDFLDRAEALNPLRVQTYRVRGQIMAADPPLPEDEAAQRAQAAFEQALRVDPHHYKTRLDYAQFLLRRGQTGRARAVLEAGLDYWYYPEPPLIAYLAVTAHHLERAGHEARAARVRGRVRRVNQRIARRREAARG